MGTGLYKLALLLVLLWGPAAGAQQKDKPDEPKKNRQAALTQQELEVVEQLELLEHLELLEKMDLVKDLPLLEGSGGGK
jgi:hypothetical protein